MDNGYCFSSHSLSPSTWPFFIFLTAVYSSHWYLEHWMHLCRDSIRKTSFPWKKCGSPVGSNHRPTWYSTSRCYFTGRLPLLFPLWLCESSRYTVLFIPLRWWNYKWEMRKQGSIIWLWRRSHPCSFLRNFPNRDPLALHLLEKVIAFYPKDCPFVEEVHSHWTCFIFDKYIRKYRFFCIYSRILSLGGYC